MSTIIEYIVSNYTWFLIGAIIILLAIIGSYADKTNFGQGKHNNCDDSLLTHPYDLKVHIKPYDLKIHIETYLDI